MTNGPKITHERIENSEIATYGTVAAEHRRLTEAERRAAAPPPEFARELNWEMSSQRAS